MIKEFKVTNFSSIYKTQTISFSISKKDMLDDSSFETTNGNKLNSILTVIGNNASGKTNILKALFFLLWFAQKSYGANSIDKDIPIETHKLHPHPSEYSSFELIFENERKEYQYKLSLNSKTVIYESLGRKNVRSYSNIYEIEKKEDSFSILKWSIAKLSDKDKNRFDKIKNVSMFSFLLNTGHLPAIGINNMVTYTGNIWLFGKKQEDIFHMYRRLTNVFVKNPDRKEKVLGFIKDAELGISDFNFIDINEKSELLVKHNNIKNEFDLSFLQESNGTQNCIYLLNLVMFILNNGGILIYDELESNLHPYLAKKIIGLFANKEKNPKYAQLLFSTHMPFLLNDRTKTQIYLVEKNENFETEIYRLDEVEGVRNDDNFRVKYLSGAYGAVPKRWF
ncbi:MAG: AAA family ATPase [Clostridioides sp.]|jgi:AAA15 family ATPase/GTPase|nr:AAA family ATPase [Clostridioides sp.]